jgi:hypothetical protein
MDAVRKESPGGAVGGDDWIRARPAAAALGITFSTVLHRCLLGQLEWKVVGGIVFVSRASVERAARSRPVAVVGA